MSDQRNMRNRMTRYKTTVLYLLLAALTMAAYSPTFTGGFILDDRPLIERNDYLRRPHSLASYLSQEDGVADKEDGGLHHTGYYRPLVTLSYRLNYILAGMDARAFRAVNLALHVSTCLVLFGFLRGMGKSPGAPFWIVLLYALHPVNTEAVSWVSSRNNIMAALFMLLSLRGYIRSWERGGLAGFIVSLLAFASALFSKEFGVMTLPILFLYHRFLCQEKRNLWKEALSYLPYLLVLLIYFSLRKVVVGAFVSPFSASDMGIRIFFLPTLFFLNLKLVFLPHGLHFLYVRYPESLLHLPALLSAVLFLLLGVVLWRWREQGPTLFSALAFFLCLLPVLNLVPSASTEVTLLAMRWLYLPLAFLCVGGIVFLKVALDRKRGLVTALLVPVALYFGSYTFVLNRGHWHDDHRFFEQEVRHFGNLFLAGDLASSYFERGNYREAAKYFRIAVDQYPLRFETLLNYAAFLVETRRPRKALSLLDRAAPLIKTRADRGKWHGNRGLALLRMGRTKDALGHFRKAVIYFPQQAKAWSNLGGILGQMRRYEESEKALLRALQIDPHFADAKMNLARTYIGMKRSAQALAILNRVPEEVLGKEPGLMKWKRRAEKEKRGATSS